MADLDVLGRTLSKFGGSFSVDDATLTFPNLTDRAAFVPFVVTQLGLSYQQQISRFYGLNRSEVFLVAGRAQGQANLAQILSPQGALSEFFKTYGDVCKADGNDLAFNLADGCNGANAVTSNGQSTKFTAKTCVINQLAFNTESESAVVNNNFSMTYESLIFEQGLAAA